MKQICAWCGIGATSYGICLPCANKVITNVPHTLRSFLEQINVPVLLVDRDGVIRIANKMAAAMVQKKVVDIEGNLGGDVFQCVYATLPHGCGNTVHCSGCVIRRSVMQTHETGEGVSRLPATLKQSSPNEPQEVKLLISTEKLGDYVALKILGD